MAGHAEAQIFASLAKKQIEGAKEMGRTGSGSHSAMGCLRYYWNSPNHSLRKITIFVNALKRKLIWKREPNNVRSEKLSRWLSKSAT